MIRANLTSTQSTQQNLYKTLLATAAKAKPDATDYDPSVQSHPKLIFSPKLLMGKSDQVINNSLNQEFTDEIKTLIEGNDFSDSKKILLCIRKFKLPPQQKKEFPLLPFTQSAAEIQREKNIYNDLADPLELFSTAFNQFFTEEINNPETSKLNEKEAMGITFVNAEEENLVTDVFYFYKYLALANRLATDANKFFEIPFVNQNKYGTFDSLNIYYYQSIRNELKRIINTMEIVKSAAQISRDPSARWKNTSKLIIQNHAKPGSELHQFLFERNKDENPVEPNEIKQYHHYLSENIANLTLKSSLKIKTGAFKEKIRESLSLYKESSMKHPDAIKLLEVLFSGIYCTSYKLKNLDYVATHKDMSEFLSAMHDIANTN
ncbi:hypothetical protein [Paraburkholderia hayleyella]|uniref:hypothetical protein n=1 Tax=Paraburkholderia hayleyella TaxID=2152889 RepID=UPI00129233F0|nr:hypothetical protein [Paraburkholderia hayleyella]